MLPLSVGDGGGRLSLPLGDIASHFSSAVFFCSFRLFLIFRLWGRFHPVFFRDWLLMDTTYSGFLPEQEVLMGPSACHWNPPGTGVTC